MAFVICLKNKSINSFFITIWMCLSVILSDYYSMKINKGFDRFMSGIWLLVCSVLLAAFSGQIWNLLIRSQPIDSIDSLDDLYSKPQWSNATIFTLEYLDFAEFADKVDSPMAKNFKKRIKLLDAFDFIFVGKFKYSEDVINRFLNGKLVFAFDKLSLHYFKNFHLKNRGLNEGFDLHISRFGDGMRPYFVYFTPRMTDRKTHV